MRGGWYVLLASAALSSPAQAQQAQQVQRAGPAAPAELFRASLDHDLAAERAVGEPRPLFASDVGIVTDGAIGGAARAADTQVLAWGAPGNLYAQRGTLSFFWRSHQPIGRRQFPIFRVGYPDHTSWDMAFLRLDWNGHGFDAFVTDANLSRLRVSFDAPVPAAEAWTHFAIGWDERRGLTLWVNGRPAARTPQTAVLDNALYAFGPHSRVISGYQVQSAYDFQRGGDLDELRSFDRMLDDAAVAALATKRDPVLAALPPRDGTDRGWRYRYGFDRPDEPPPYLTAPATRIAVVRPTEARDLKARFWRGNDGIRETTWPGVYNRSRLPGRLDYFILPDWNVYSAGGKALDLTLPARSWNRLEVQGAADGTLLSVADGRGTRIGSRAPGRERTSLQLDAARTGGALRFVNRMQETPIREIGVLMVEAGTAPAGSARLDYTVRAEAAADYPTLDELNRYVSGRYVADEREVAVALPTGAPQKLRTSVGRSMPLVHLMIPADFRNVAPGGPISRFDAGWANLPDGLDGIELRLPAMKLQATHHGRLVPLNIRVKDPLWPDRDLLDVNVSVRPGEARTLWLDLRDRLLPANRSLYLQIASAAPDFDAASLDGTGVGLVFKPRAEALAEHVADREEQVRGELAQFVEEQPNNRLLPVYEQFDRDVSDLLRVDPYNATGRLYWTEQNGTQSLSTHALSAPAPGVPEWAHRQIEDLGLVRRFVDWWIDHRQLADGEFGGGLSDDSDLLHQWPPLALMGVAPERYRASQAAALDAIYRTGMLTDGLNTIRADELHSYEEGINAVAQYALLNPGSPRAIEQLMATARRYGDLTVVNAAGHRHFVSNSFAANDMWAEGPWARQKGNNFLMFHPGILLVQWNGAPLARAAMLETLDGYLAHGRSVPGGVVLPSLIDWLRDAELGGTGASGAPAGLGLGASTSAFWAAYRWTGDAKYLAPLSADAPRSLVALSPDVMSELGRQKDWGPAFVQAADEPDTYRPSNTGGAGSELSMARFAAWQVTGDKTYLERLYAAEVRSAMQRMPMMTEGELWTDRVQIASEILQRSRLGGVASRRNQIFPGHRVSWHFADADGAGRVAIVFPEARSDRLRIVAFNTGSTPLAATLVGADVTAGRWTLSQGPDANNDNRADAPTRSTVDLGPGEAVPLVLPPGQSVLALDLAQAGPSSASRGDVGLDPADVRRVSSGVIVTAHGLGAVATPAGEVMVERPDGTLLGRGHLPSIEAPADLRPRTAAVTVRLPASARTGPVRIRLVLDGAPPEISRANNEVLLP